jgi:hypothetical protein
VVNEFELAKLDLMSLVVILELMRHELVNVPRQIPRPAGENAGTSG